MFSKLSSLIQYLQQRRATGALFICACVALILPIVLAYIDGKGLEHVSVNNFVGERMNSYVGTWKLTPTGQVHVEENIRYDFRSASATGFTRVLSSTLPLGGYLPTQRDIRFANVTRREIDEPFIVQESPEYAAIRTGSKNQPLTGQHDYLLTYDINSAVVRTETHDVVRLSPTDVTVGASIEMIDIYFHGPVPPNYANCFVGTSAQTVTAPCRTSVEGITIHFQTPRWIEAGEGVFIELYYPLGTFSSPVFPRPSPLIPAWALIIAAHFFIMLGIWFVVGRDDRGKGTVVPDEAFLDHIKPYEAGALLAQRPSFASFVGMILDLAERGAVKLSRYEGGGYLSFDIERANKKAPLDGVEAQVLNRLFAYPFADASNTEEAGQASFGHHDSSTKLAYALFEKRVYEHLVNRG